MERFKIGKRALYYFFGKRGEHIVLAGYRDGKRRIQVAAVVVSKSEKSLRGNDFAVFHLRLIAHLDVAFAHVVKKSGR